ncbi:MAG: hypothetical protein ABI662_02070 [Dermatophilaceae bacterium]
MADRKMDMREQLTVTSDDASLQDPQVAVRSSPTASARAEVLVAVAAFVALCFAVLVRSANLLEPDDYAYRASILALTQGHWLSLTNAEYQGLLKQLSSGGGMGIAQWVHTASGTWISEKNPGYPFLAVPFQALGVLRVAPLFYGALGALGLFFGGRRWLGRWGGAWAVVLFCSSGAALAFAGRATMPTFTDASLIAAGAGALLWAMLAVERTARRRIVIGMLGFVALEAAVLVRYTNLVILAVAVLAVLVVFRRAALPLRAIGWWLGSVAVLFAGVLGFDYLAYGSPLNTGYSAGEITFSSVSVIPNLQHMPVRLLTSMPMLVLALGALGWMAVRAAASRRRGSEPRRSARHRRDAVIGAVLAAGWVSIWGLYAAYDWTARMGSAPGRDIHLIRFYLPAIGLIALLGAWLLVQLARWLPVVILVVLIGLGSRSYPDLVAGGLGGPGGGGGGAPGRGGQGATGGLPHGIGGGTDRLQPGPGGPSGAPAPGAP